MSSSTRLYVASVPRDAAELSLGGDRAHYLSRVLRLGAGAPLVLFDGSGAEFDGVVRRVSRQAVVVALGARRDRDLESPLAIHLVQGVSRGERMDFVVQKATELGVGRITPVLTERSVARYDAARAKKRLRHWLGIAASACEQCGRNRLPAIDSPLAFSRWLERPAEACDLRLLLDPRAPARLAGDGPAPRTLQPSRPASRGMSRTRWRSSRVLARKA